MEIKKKKISQAKSAKKSGESWLTKDIAILPFKVNEKRKEYFYSQLDLLIRSGFDLRSSLELLIEEATGKWKEVVKEVYKKVVEGKLLSEVLSENKHFTSYEFESLKIGEESGIIEDIFRELGLFYQRKIELRRKFIGVMLYPVIVLLVSFAVVYFMLNVVVPMFEDMFQRFDSELPGLTKFVIGLSDSFEKAIPWLMLVSIGLVILNYVLRKNTEYAFLKERLIFGIPLFGNFAKMNYQSRFCQNMRLLLTAHTPLVHALQLTSNMLSNVHYERGIKEVIQKVSVGDPLYVSLKETNLFDPRMLSLIRVGEEVNQLGVMFDKLSVQLSADIEYKSKQLSSLLEPFIIIILGLVVGVILIAMYLPILNLSTIIS